VTESSKNLPRPSYGEHDLSMKVASLETIFSALQKAEVRYLVVGGLAVIAHGYTRLTQDIDLVLDFSPDSLSRALTALESLGYRPLVPVKLRDFGDAALREQWKDEKNMKVFQVVSDVYPDAPIDLFITEPFAFGVEYARAKWYALSNEIEIPVVSLPALMAMKAAAGRDHDRLDMDRLREVSPSYAA